MTISIRLSLQFKLKDFDNDCEGKQPQLLLYA